MLSCLMDWKGGGEELPSSIIITEYDARSGSPRNSRNNIPSVYRNCEIIFF